MSSVGVEFCFYIGRGGLRVSWFLWVASSSGRSLVFSGSYSHPCTRIKAAAQYDQYDQVKRNLAQFKLWRRSALPRDQVRQRTCATFQRVLVFPRSQVALGNALVFEAVL